MDSHSQIEDEVVQWLARRDSGNWSEDDEVRLQQWIGVSTARRVAYLRLQSSWDTAARLRVLRAGPLPGTSRSGDVPAPGEWKRSPFFEQSVTPRKHAAVDPESDGLPGATARRRLSYFGLVSAAVVVLAITSGFIADQFGGTGDRYTTAVGGFASVPMTDGSKVTLNTDSEIRVAVTEKERRIDLEHGEAFFEVAHDRTRPFVVLAGDKRVTAVGTKFSVQHLGGDVRVLVTEGKVRVESSDSRATASTFDAGAVLLAAGDIARADGSAVVVQKAPAPQVEEFLSWREGYLRFHETALADAVAEINRYNRRKIFIDDPQLAALKISGTFRPTQYEAFVRVLQDGFSVQVRIEGESITLTQGP
jgi:transmembrane sensor